MAKEKLLVSVSGGETSMFMAKWLFDNKQNEYEMQFVFANTGLEHEETLVFVDKFSKHFRIPITWVEPVINTKFEILGNTYISNSENNIFNRIKYVLRKRYGISRRKFKRLVTYKPCGTTYKKVNFESATRGVKLFEEAIKKYGLFHIKNPTCTKELKERPIHSFVKKQLKWKKYFTAIGIRVDEFDRMSVNKDKMKLIYPLVSQKPMTKKHINAFWKFQPFRLELTGYNGNCKACYKKSFSKLKTIALENASAFEEALYLEKKIWLFCSS